MNEAKKLIVYCAIPFRPGIDKAENAEWGFDVDGTRYAHEQCGEKSVGLAFYEAVKSELPEDWRKHWNYPVGGPTAEAISWELPLEKFRNPEKMLELLKFFWPKACHFFGV